MVFLSRIRIKLGYYYAISLRSVFAAWKHSLGFGRRSLLKSVLEAWKLQMEFIGNETVPSPIPLQVVWTAWEHEAFDPSEPRTANLTLGTLREEPDGMTRT